jgi:membrane protease YdiL (CAAX protease family)
VASIAGVRLVFVPRLALAPVVVEIGIGMLAAGIVLLLTWLGERLPLAADLEAEFRRLLGRLTLGEICVVAVASGIGEEVLFRGALQPILGYVPASLLFGLVHTGPGRHFRLWTVFALIVGFLFGAVFEWRQSLLSVITAHALVNGVNLHRISRRPLAGGEEAV